MAEEKTVVSEDEQTGKKTVVCIEDEPEMKPGLVDLDNVVIVPHIASATRWTREGMATLAATNVAGLLKGYAVWNRPDILPFLETEAPKAAPSIVNAEDLNLRFYDG